jgi:hypothetical protein
MVEANPLHRSSLTNAARRVTTRVPGIRQIHENFAI